MLFLAALWFSTPAWFPWLLRPLALRVGARFTSYERLGYNRFRLNRLVFRNQSLDLHAAEVEGFVPNVWLWKLAIGGQRRAGPFVEVQDWTCRLLPSNKPSGPAKAKVQDVAAVLRTLQRWVPAANASNGVVRSGELAFTLRHAALRDGVLDIQLTLPPQASGQSITAKVSPGAPFKLQIGCSSLGLDSDFIVSTNQVGFEVQNTTFWRSNRFEAQAQFGSIDTLPRTASLRATNCSVPADLLKLPYYESLNGSLAANWQEGHFGLQIAARATPDAAQTNWPPADVTLSVRGDTNVAVVERLAIDSAFLQASLSDPLEVGFSAPFVRGSAKLNLKADLARQSWVPVAGQIVGRADVTRGAGQFPVCALDLTGTNVGLSSVKAKTIAISARFEWPTLQITHGDARFDDGSSGQIWGQFNVQEKVVSGGNVRFEGPLARRWLPAAYSFSNLAIGARFEGPVTEINHSGRLLVSQVSLPRVRPFALGARWNGRAKVLQHFSLELSGTNSMIAAAGGLKLDTNQLQLTLESLSIQTNGISAMELQKPWVVSYSGHNASQSWGLSASPIEMLGPAGQVNAQASIHWPEEGACELAAQRLPIKLLSAFTEAELPEIKLSGLQASAAWSNSPVACQVVASITGRVSPPAVPKFRPKSEGSSRRLAPDDREAIPAELLSTPLTLDFNLNANASGLVLSNLVLNSPTSMVAVASGFVPVTFNPARGTNIVEVRADEPLAVKCSIRPQAFFWESISQLAGIRLQDPTVDLQLGGTSRTPEGHLLAAVRRIQLKDITLTNLDLSDLRLAVDINRTRLRLDEGHFFVQGQRVSLTGDLPLDQDSWTELTHKKLPSWEKATAQVRIDNARLAAFESLFPEVISPQGELSVDLQLLPEARLEGALTLRHARTRPLGNTAPVRDINVTLRFHDRVLALENASATLSGARVDLEGRADLRGTEWRAGMLPPFALTLRGTNVPLAREPEYIIRSDLDLAILKTNSEPPSVMGTAHLRDSYFLSDLSALIPGKVATPESRPPFFSIDDPTVAGWRLAVAVDGVRWLKVRTSLFNGEVSANLRLEGTLKDPIALGVVKVDSGLVRFPFASLRVQQGLVTLTSQDPYHPQLLVRAASKQFGYDIRMELTGSVDSPIVQFTSNPALSSEQILLMITAGQLPQGSFTLTPQQRAQTVALFLGRDLLSKLGLGDQSQDRLTISSGEEISAQNRPTYHVEYKLTPRWSVTGEYDRFGDFNAGFKWRVYSK